MQVHTKDSLWASIENSFPASAITTAVPVALAQPEFLPEEEAPDLDRLASALASLNPDAEDQKTWRGRRIRALVNTAIKFPAYRDQLYALARDFSSGRLRNVPSQFWAVGVGSDEARRHEFPRIWKWYMTSTFAGRPVGVGTIFGDAINAGWNPRKDVTRDGQCLHAATGEASRG